MLGNHHSNLTMFQKIRKTKLRRSVKVVSTVADPSFVHSFQGGSSFPLSRQVTLKFKSKNSGYRHTLPQCNGILNYALVVANTNFHFLKPMLIPRQGDLFLYGTEALICPINRKGSWVGCLGWQRGRARTFFLSIFLRSFFR